MKTNQMTAPICPNNPQQFVNFLVNAIWQRVKLPLPLFGEEESAWNSMVQAAANKQYIAAAIEAGRHPVTLHVWEMALDMDRQTTH